MRYLGPANPPEVVAVQHRLRLAAAVPVAGLGYWAGFFGDAFVGWWVLEPPLRPDQVLVAGQAELGYRLLRRFWRRGLAGEGARELVRYGFEELGLERIFAEAMAVNAGSRATMTAAGLTFARAFHQQWSDPLPGSEHGEVEYAITREQWAASQRGRGTIPPQSTIGI